MRLHRFYIEEKIGDRKEVTVKSAELVNQISRVFRLKVSDEVVFFDGSGDDFTCAIDGGTSFDEKLVKFTVVEKTGSRYMPTKSGREIVLCAAVVKKDTFEWIVEKATELGVTKIIPVIAERSEKKALNEERLRKIAVEASEQSGRGDVPIISAVSSLDEAVNNLKPTTQMIAFHTEGDVLKGVELESKGPLAIFIGPEGGWSPVEIALFHKEMIPVICLGPQVLRAETAVIAALSQVVFG